MAEPTSLPASDQVSAEQSYRPVSLLAVAGLLLSSLFAFIVLSVGGYALFSGEPFRLGFLWLLLPFAGLFVSAVALWQIRLSEGTRTGGVLATTGVWLSILFGLGYAAYAVATYFAVTEQAKQFLLGEDTGPEMGFLAKFRDRDKLNAAFLLTQPPEDRGNANADDPRSMDMQFNLTKDPGRPGQLIMFRDSLLVRILQNGGKDSTFKVLSVNKCEFEKGGYVVSMDVEIQTPDLVMRTPLELRSQDLPRQDRKWFVNWNSAPRTPDPGWQFTPQGKQLNKLFLESYRFAQAWVIDLAEGRVDKVLQGTLRKDDWRPGGPAVDYTPIWDAKRAEKAREEINKLLKGADDRPFVREISNPDKPWPLWERNDKNNHPRVSHQFELRCYNPKKHDQIKMLLTARLTVERTDSKEVRFARGTKPKFAVVGMQVLDMRDTPPGPIRMPMPGQPPK
jgi:hypothetical protein